MYPVSDAYLQAIKSTSRVYRVFGAISTAAGKTYTLSDDNIMQGSLSYDSQCVNGEDLNFGSVYAAQLKFGMVDESIDRYSLYDAVVELSFELETSDGLEVVPIGKFIVTEATRVYSVINITALDSMIELDDECMSTTNGTPFHILEWIADSKGITLAQTKGEIEALTNGTRRFGMSDTSGSYRWRDLLSDLAEVLCCFARFDREDRLELRPFALTVSYEADENARFNTEVADFSVKYSKLIVEAGDDIITVGQGNGLEWVIKDNALLVNGLQETKQAVVDSIFEFVSALSYTPTTVDYVGDPAIDLGDMIRYSDTVISLVTKVHWKYRGSQAIESVGKNWRLAKVQTKTDRDIGSAVSQQAGMNVISFDNSNSQTINAFETEVASIFYSVSDDKMTPMYSVALVLDVEAPGTFISKMRVNGSMSYFEPMQILATGANTIAFIVPIANVAKGIQNDIKMYLTSPDGGLARLERFNLRAAVIGGAVSSGDGTWNGIIELEDEIGVTQFRTRIPTLSEMLETRLYIPEPVGLTETVQTFAPRISLYAYTGAPPLILDSFTLSYSGNGNTAGDVPPTQTGAMVYTVAGNDFGLSKAGFEFDGWDTLPNGMGLRYRAGDTITMTTDITLYAAWKVA